MELEVRKNGQTIAPGNLQSGLSKLTAYRVMQVGEKAMQAYLKVTTDALAKRHSLPHGSTGNRRLASITGEGIARLQDFDVRQDSGEVEGVVPLLPYMVRHEFGGTIQAGSGAYLTVPLPAALNGDGTPKRLSARQWRDAFVIKSRSGNLLIVRRRGRVITPLYALKESVRIPKRLGLRSELRKQRPKLQKAVVDGIRILITS
ncbi:MAG: hypothetical protein ACU0CC_14725 [Sagittula sp.]|uniref:hypothetical protein n=1 Tax=Sagittula sp. TaxID=2038081 RepID=UPI004058D08E